MQHVINQSIIIEIYQVNLLFVFVGQRTAGNKYRRNAIGHDIDELGGSDFEKPCVNKVTTAHEPQTDFIPGRMFGFVTVKYL